MLDPEKVNDRLNFKFEFELTDQQRALLTASVRQEPFQLLQKVMEEELKNFNTRLMNTPASKPEDVLANHMSAQAATQWYVGFMSRLSEMVRIEQYSQLGIGTKANPEASPVSQDFE